MFMTIDIVSHKKRVFVKIADTFLLLITVKHNGIGYCWVESGSKRRKRIVNLNTWHFYLAQRKNSLSTSNNKLVSFEGVFKWSDYFRFVAFIIAWNPFSLLPVKFYVLNCQTKYRYDCIMMM